VHFASKYPFLPPSPPVDAEPLRFPPGAGGVSHLKLHIMLYDTCMGTSEHQFNLNVTFRLDNILKLNGRQIETADLTPDALKVVIQRVDDDLKLHFAALEAFDRDYSLVASRFIRPVIHIARLALLDQQYDALKPQALLSHQRHITHPNLLTEEAFAYWNSIDKTEYQPQVHVLSGTDRQSSGVWLGISEA